MNAPLGRILASPSALDVVAPWELPALLRRHAASDWGEVDAHDPRANETVLRTGERLLSAYTPGARRVWIITEADRSATTVLLPEEG